MPEPSWNLCRDDDKDVSKVRSSISKKEAVMRTYTAHIRLEGCRWAGEGALDLKDDVVASVPVLRDILL